MRHNITGSEAFGPREHVQIYVLRRRRKLHPAVWLYPTFAGLGLVAGLIDAWTGAPAALPVVIAGLAVWAFWTGRS